jgi:tripartite-type tricarboxylate transporter receptor subunit TctC
LRKGQGARELRILHLVTAATLGWFVTTPPASAQSFPSKPIRIVVPSSAGGGADTTARLLAQKLSDLFGQQAIVDNRPGAGNIIGTEMVAKAPPDGYTLLMAINNHAINASLYRKLPYDPIQDFAPISLIATAPNILVVHPSLPVRSVHDLVRLAKARPGQINYASAGNGTAAHFAAELFKLDAKVQMTHIPYKSLSGAVIDVVSGAVQVMFPSPLTALGQIKAGRLRALAVTTARRSPSMPELPTIQESGITGYEFSSWYGLLAPRATPDSVVAKLSQEVMQIVRSKEVEARLTGDGGDPVGNTPDEFDVFLKAEVEKYAKLVKEIGLRID